MEIANPNLAIPNTDGTAGEAAEQNVAQPNTD